MAYLDPQVLKNICRGKTEDQKKAIEYFCKQPGCLSKVISDEEYIALVTKKRDSLNLKQKALGKIGLDESEVSEIKPAMFEGYIFKNAWSKQRANGKWVSSAYQVSWLFFSATQIYIYRCTFNMDEDKISESTDEFFYKDVVSFSTTSETEDGKSGNQKIQVESNKFCMVVPGDKLYVSMDDVEDSEAIIQAMKQKLREKKM